MLGKANIHVSKIGIYMYKKKAMNTEQILGKPVFKTGFCGFKLVSIALYCLVQTVKWPALWLYLPSTVTRSTQKVWELKSTTRRSLVLNSFLAGGSTSHGTSVISLESHLPWLQPLSSSVQFSFSVMSESWQPHGLEHARLPCPSPTPRADSNSCPPSQWCHPTTSSSVVPFSSCLQFFQSSGSFLMSQLFISGGQSIEVSASASVLLNIQDWFP